MFIGGTLKLKRLRLSNFRSFSTDFTEIELDDITFMLGPNGAGKTAVLQALARMFSLDPNQRKVKSSDFHVPLAEAPDSPPDERTLWIEADFEFPELIGEDGAVGNFAVPGNFLHMQLLTPGGPAQVRFRLDATLDQDNEVEEEFTYVLNVDDDDAPTEKGRVAKQDRNAIQVHYLPARRDPADHISYAANALLGRALRAANWAAERVAVDELTEQISASLADNAAIKTLAETLSINWGALHTGTHFKDPSITFGRSEIESLLRHMSIVFASGHGEPLVDFSRLSDGQQSVLYLSIVLSAFELGQKVLAGELVDAYDIDKLRPAIFTLVAVEEPENSLSPYYLGRVVRRLTDFSAGANAQAVLATHAPSMMRRVEPEHVRFLRLDDQRTTTVRSIDLPEKEKDAEAYKFIREAVQAFPELYFSRLVVLGEGDSEEVVIPRLLSAVGTITDDASISVVPLGGRHVNHFWRLLYGLGIPFVTLLDLDLARYQGGWGRISYAAKQLLLYEDILHSGIDQAAIDVIPAWNSDKRLKAHSGDWIDWLEKQGVFFSSKLDLDLAMLVAFPDAYSIDEILDLAAPDADTLKSVLGKKHDVVDGQYEASELQYFDAYNSKFKVGSKPAWHIQAIANLDDDAVLAAGMPGSLRRLVDRVQALLATIPE